MSQIAAEHEVKIVSWNALDLRKIPATPDKLPGRITAFSSGNVALATLPSEKNTSASLESLPRSVEVLRKSSEVSERINFIRIYTIL